MIPKKTILFCLVLLILPMAFATVGYDLNTCQDDNSFGAMGNCLVRGAFGGDYMFFAIIFLLVTAMFMWQAKAPMGAALVLGVTTIFMLSPFLGNVYTALLNLFLLVLGAMVGIMIIRFVR